MALSLSSTVRLNNGIDMPTFGLGTFRAPSGEVTQDAVCAALQVGYRLLDTAVAYKNETDVGIGLARSGVARAKVFVTTKLWLPDMSYDGTMAACHASLERLGLQTLDLYLIHWPKPGCWQDSWRAMETLLAEGTVRAIGVSNFYAHHLEELLGFATVPPAVNQVEFSPFLYQHELLEYCRNHQIVMESYSPLTAGMKLDHPTVVEIAHKYGKSPAQILIRWPLQHGLVVIPKSVHPARIRENSEVFDFEIAADDMARLDSLDEDFHTLPADWRSRFA